MKPSMKPILTVLLSITLGAAVSADAKGVDKLEQLEESNSLSQLLRSNTPHYWSYAKTNSSSEIKKFLSFDGIVVGDPHLGNFGVMPVASKGANNSGRREMRFLLNDFDDAGHGPFVLDFIRLEIMSEAANSGVKKRDLEEAYIRGLQGYRVSPPEKIQNLLSMTVNEYDELAATKVEKKTTNSKFELKKGELEAYRGSLSREDIEKAMIQIHGNNVEILDVAKRPIARGGSKDSLRLWVLADLREGSRTTRKIYELKEYQVPALAKYREQKDVVQWQTEIQSALWPGLDTKSYSLVKIQNSKYFWVREKKISLLDVPYTSEKKSDENFVNDIAVYDCYILGLLHGRQPNGSKLAAAISKDPEVFHRATELEVDNYLKVIKKLQ